MNNHQSTRSNQPVPFQIHFSRQFASWLDEVQASLMCTTYQAGKVFMFGLGEQGVSVAERTFARVMGLGVDSSGFYLASLFQLWRFENILSGNERYQNYDRLYVPQFAWTTGDLDIHDIGVQADGQPVFVNSLFSCLGKPSVKYSFEPVWRPSFISRLAAEDRCHLNGLAMHGGEPAYVTAISRADGSEGWRDHRADGGVVIDVPTNSIICQGLSMPHSPRLHMGKLWVLNSGAGELGFVDRETGRFEVVGFCPGYARGLSFIGKYAIVGLSKPRNQSFSGLALDDVLEKRAIKPKCGIAVFDLDTGDNVHNLWFDGVIEELYDVAILPGVIRPLLLGLKTDEIRRVLRLPPDAD